MGPCRTSSLSFQTLSQENRAASFVGCGNNAPKAKVFRRYHALLGESLDSCPSRRVPPVHAAAQQSAESFWEALRNGVAAIETVVAADWRPPGKSELRIVIRISQRSMERISRLCGDRDWASGLPRQRFRHLSLPHESAASLCGGSLKTILPSKPGHCPSASQADETYSLRIIPLSRGLQLL